MSLRAAFQQAAITAFNALDDIPVSCTYRSMTDDQPEYDPADGSVTEAYTDYTVDLILTSVKLREVEGSDIIQTNDKWALVPATSLTPTPKNIDIIIINSIEWNITDINTDPAGALWKILIRKG